MNASCRDTPDRQSVSDRDSCELRNRNPGAAFVPLAKARRCDASVLAENLAHAIPECTSTLAVNDTQATQIGSHRGINGMCHNVIHVGDSKPTHVDLDRCADLGRFRRHGNRFGGRGSIRAAQCARRDMHFHRTNRHQGVAVPDVEQPTGSATEHWYVYHVPDGQGPRWAAFMRGLGLGRCIDPAEGLGLLGSQLLDPLACTLDLFVHCRCGPRHSPGARSRSARSGPGH